MQPLEIDRSNHFTLDKGLRQIKKAYKNLRGSEPGEDVDSVGMLTTVQEVMKPLSETLLAIQSKLEGKKCAYRLLACIGLGRIEA